jgi:hypothetical protein
MSQEERPSGLTLDDAIRRFTDAETALRSLLASADSLRSASNLVHQASAAIEAAQKESAAVVRAAGESVEDGKKSAALLVQQATDSMEDSKKSAVALVQKAIVSLGVAESGVRDTASAIFNLTSEIKDIARDLKDTAQGFRALQPERLTKEIEALKATQRRTFQAVMAAAAAGLAVVILLTFSRWYG